MKNTNAKSRKTAKPSRDKSIKFTGGDWSLLRWGKELKGHFSDAGHIVQAHDGKIGIEIARLPVASITDENVPDGPPINRRQLSRAESLANGRLLTASPRLFRALVATWIIIEGSPDILHHVGHCTSKDTGKTLHETVRELIAEVEGGK